MKLKSWLTLICVVALLSGRQVLAQEEWQVLGNTLWVAGDNRLTLDMPMVSTPASDITSYLRVITSEPGERWISASIPFAWQKTTIKAILLCFQTPDTGSFISLIRLVQYITPAPPATVVHDDTTTLFSMEGNCYRSDVGNYTPAGAVNLFLRLSFAGSGDEIRLGGLAVLVEKGE